MTATRDSRTAMYNKDDLSSLGPIVSSLVCCSSRDCYENYTNSTAVQKKIGKKKQSLSTPVNLHSALTEWHFVRFCDISIPTYMPRAVGTTRWGQPPSQLAAELLEEFFQPAATLLRNYSNCPWVRLCCHSPAPQRAWVGYLDAMELFFDEAWSLFTCWLVALVLLLNNTYN